MAKQKPHKFNASKEIRDIYRAYGHIANERVYRILTERAQAAGAPVPGRSIVSTVKKRMRDEAKAKKATPKNNRKGADELAKLFDLDTPEKSRAKIKKLVEPPADPPPDDYPGGSLTMSEIAAVVAELRPIATRLGSWEALCNVIGIVLFYKIQLNPLGLK